MPAAFSNVPGIFVAMPNLVLGYSELERKYNIDRLAARIILNILSNILDKRFH